MSTQTALVSAPVGGVPVSADLAPSIIFAILYALLLPKIIYNFFIRKPRSISSGGRMNYVQMTVGLGFIGISSDTVKLLRTLLVNTTLPENGAGKDRPVARGLSRRLCYVFELSFLASTIPGIVGGSKYSAARTSQDLADKNVQLLYASTGVVFGLEVVTIVGVLAAAFWVKGVDRRCCFELAALTVLIMPVSIYRLCVLHIHTNNVFDPISPSSHAAFYVVHLLPEWLCVFNTGRWGDYELMDRSRNKRLERARRDSEVGPTQPLKG
ncbi:hypothetical protein BDV93DRAFT_553963 [Ceratobasidium sp. AG-I]|nr:hypothetical protein BDV93DRAFT_553963 [Ceratobasidium sp. AG-I]